MAQTVVATTHRVVLPHHYNVLKAWCAVFEEIRIYKNRIECINKGIYKTHLLLLTHEGQRVTLTKEQRMQDTVIIDLTGIAPSPEAMHHFLLETEDARYWHHAPEAVTNQIRNYRK